MPKMTDSISYAILVMKQLAKIYLISKDGKKSLSYTFEQIEIVWVLFIVTKVWTKNMESIRFVMKDLSHGYLLLRLFLCTTNFFCTHRTMYDFLWSKTANEAQILIGQNSYNLPFDEKSIRIYLYSFIDA